MADVSGGSEIVQPAIVESKARVWRSEPFRIRRANGSFNFEQVRRFGTFDSNTVLFADVAVAEMTAAEMGWIYCLKQELIPCETVGRAKLINIEEYGEKQGQKIACNLSLSRPSLAANEML